MANCELEAAESLACTLMPLREAATTLEAATEARIEAEVAEGFATWTREQLAEICLRYPGAVKSRFRPGHGLLDSIPKPWPQSAKSSSTAKKPSNREDTQ